MATYHMNANERITDVPGTLVFECYDRRMLVGGLASINFSSEKWGQIREGAQHFGVSLPEWQGNRYEERYNALYNDLAALAVRLSHSSTSATPTEQLFKLLEQHK
jgi:hypothetical protein